jgi:hypothetical protein
MKFVTKMTALLEKEWCHSLRNEESASPMQVHLSPFLPLKMHFFEIFSPKRLQIQKIVVPLHSQSRTKAFKQKMVW